MSKFDFKISLTEASKAEAEEKVKAVTVLIQHLTVKELKKFAEVAKNEPAKIALAKSYLGIKD